MDFGKDFSVLQKNLDALWLRQKLISNNIANIDTPGYKAKSLEFEKIFKEYLETEDKKDLSEIDFSKEVTEDASPAVREDGNNVDIDKQNIELVRAQLQYEYVTRVISDEISRQKYVINEGKR